MRKQCVTARVAVEVLSRELQSTMRASKIKSYVDGFFFLIYKIVNVQSDFCSYFRVFRAFSRHSRHFFFFDIVCQKNFIDYGFFKR